MLGHLDGGRLLVGVQLLEGVQDGINDRRRLLLRVDEQGHRQGGVDAPALGLEPAGTGAVAHALAGLGQVFLVVGEDGDQQAPGRVRVADGQGDAHAAGDADVRDDLEAARVQVLGEVDEEAIGFAGQDRPRVHSLARVPLGDLEEVDEHARALVVEALAVDVGAVQGGHEGEVAAHDAQDFGQRVGPLLAGQHAEVMDDAPVGRLREADRQDQGLAGQAHGLVGADDHEGLGGGRVEE